LPASQLADVFHRTVIAAPPLVTLPIWPKIIYIVSCLHSRRELPMWVISCTVCLCTLLVLFWPSIPGWIVAAIQYSAFTLHADCLLLCCYVRELRWLFYLSDLFIQLS